MTKAYRTLSNVNGDVAIIYSGDYGLGWYSYHNSTALTMDAVLVNYLLHKQYSKALDYIYNEYPGVFPLDEEDLKILRIEWVSPNCVFRVYNYDGKESIEYVQDLGHYLVSTPRE